MKQLFLLAASLVFAASALAQAGANFAWTSSDGRTIQASFIKLDGEAVVISMNGKQFTVPFANLTPTSVEQAKKLGGFEEPSIRGEGTLEMPAPPPQEDAPVPEPLISPSTPEGWQGPNFRATETMFDKDGGLLLVVYAGVLKLSADDGRILWATEEAGAGIGDVRQLLTGRDASLFLASQTRKEATGSDVLLAALSTDNGTVRWKQQYDGPAKGVDILVPGSLALDSGGDLVVGMVSGPVVEAGQPWSRESILLSYAAADGRLLREGRQLKGQSRSVDISQLVTGRTGAVLFYKNDFKQETLSAYDIREDKVLWEFPKPRNAPVAQDAFVDDDGIMVLPAPNFSSSRAEFMAITLKPDGMKAWELTIPEMSQKGSQSLAAGNGLLCFVGSHKESGTILLRAHDRKDGAALWKKDDLFTKDARISKQNNRNYVDLAALPDPAGNVFLGWTQLKDGEFRPLLAKFSRKGELLWVRQMAARTAPISAGLKHTLMLDAKGNPILIFEQAEPGSKPGADGIVLADDSITKRNIWTIAKFSGADGRPQWQYSRKGIVDQEAFTGFASQLMTDAEGNVVFVWALHDASSFSVLKLSVDEGRSIWETRIGKP